MTNLTQSSVPVGDVAATYDAYPASYRKRLMGLRSLILETADQHPEIGKLEETLK